MTNVINTPDTELDATVDVEKLIQEQAVKVVTEPSEDEKLQDEIKLILSPAPKDKPTIDQLADAFEYVDGKLSFKVPVGQKVVIERTTDLGDGKRVWLDTETYRVESIDQVTGELKLINVAVRAAARSNFITGLERGYSFKIPGVDGNVGKRRRGRPKKVRGLEEFEPRTTQDTKNAGAKKTRGRPKGSKNRDKATIKQEKAERTAKRQAKRLKREARLRGRVVR